MKDLMEKKAEYEKLLEAQELENAVDEKDEATIKRHKARAGRPAQKDVGSTLTRDSNRRKEGASKRKTEFGAYEKMKICNDIEKQKVSFSKEDELWAHTYEKSIWGYSSKAERYLFQEAAMDQPCEKQQSRCQ